MSVARTVVKNSGILMTVEILTRLTSVVLTVAIARTLGPADFGLFNYAFSLGGLLGILAMFGMDTLVTRDVARDRARTGSYLGSVLTVEIVFALVAVAALAVILTALGEPLERIAIVLMAGGIMLLESFIRLIACVFRAHQHMEYEALVRTFLRILNVAVCLAVLSLGYGLVGLMIAQFSVFVAALALSLFIVRGRIARPQFDLRWQPHLAILRAAVPFALSLAFINVYQRVGVIVLNNVWGDAVTGWYSGAGTFTRVFDFIPTSLEGALLPAMTALQASSREAWQEAYRRSMKYLLLIALPIAIGLAMRSQDLVHLLLGDEYSLSAGILPILVWGMLLSFLNHGAANALFSTHAENAYVKVVGAGALFNIGAVALLIPAFGPLGAAAAKVLTEGVVLTGQLIVLARAGRNVGLGRTAVRPLASGAALALALYLGAGASLFVVVPVGAAVYMAALFLFQALEKDEIALLLDLVRNGLVRFGLRRSQV